ncbi:MAG: prepilin-type N-terminal cleavage/methylation domain-containing protein, partial [Candidatus Veblenbacteria bacterium]|nr:prepilin-type N-terminal cleavage/methylation domain-containing protein [Candidatus Veblenbacteria bacterium]
MFSAVHWATLGILVFLALVLPVAVFGGAPFLPTSRRKLVTLLKLAALAPGARAVDLGSGDGRIVAALAQAGFEVTGYEVNPLLVWWSRWRLWRQGLGWSTVRLKDFWSANLAEVDLVVVFGIGSMMPRLAAKLVVELKAGAVVISNGFHVPGWRAEAHEQELYLYRVGSGLSETLTHGTLQATMPNNKRPRTGVGFTLIEVLVVIGIIGVLATMGVVAMNVARQRSYTTRAQADLRSLRNAIALLESDTYKWPNGCPSEEVANPEVNLSTTQAGLIPSPV